MDTSPTTEEPQGWREHETGLGEKLCSLREKLYRKAKQEPRFRFYALYDRIYRPDVLMAAWRIVARNRGAPGVDGITIDSIESIPGAAGELVQQLHEELRTKTYRPQPVRRVCIPKPDGRQRPLGIPTVRDRVVQTAVKLILEPIFEADFRDCSFGFRPGKSAHQAVEEVRKHVSAGFRVALDADLKEYFDSIPHDKLLAAVRMRVVDRSVLKLIQMWLRTPVEEDDDAGNRRLRRPTRGTPQGGVISPLLANIYLHWLDQRFHCSDGPACWANAKLVRYADDFVILARYVGDRLQRWANQTLEEWLGLTINRDKTRVVDLNAPKACFDFLGFRFRYFRSWRTRAGRYLHVEPSPKAEARLRERLRDLIHPRWNWLPTRAVIGRVNQTLRGWCAYFRVGHPSRVFRRIDWHVEYRLLQHVNRRSQRHASIPSGISFYEHLNTLGLVRLAAGGRPLPVHARGEVSGSAGCGKPARPVR